MARQASSKHARLKAQYVKDSAITASAVTIEGLDDFFVDDSTIDKSANDVLVDAVLVDAAPSVFDTALASQPVSLVPQVQTVQPSVQSIQTDQTHTESVPSQSDKELSIFTEKQACKELDISKKVLKARLEEGLYKTFPGTDGKVRIMLPGGKPRIKAKKEKKSEVLDFTPPVEDSPADPVVVDLVVVDRAEPVIAREPVTLTSSGIISDELVALVDRLNREAVAAAQKIGYLEAELAQSREVLKSLPELQSKANAAALVENENKSLREHILELKKVLELAEAPLWRKIWRNVKLVFAR